MLYYFVLKIWLVHFLAINIKLITFSYHSDADRLTNIYIFSNHNLPTINIF